MFEGEGPTDNHLGKSAAAIAPLVGQLRRDRKELGIGEAVRLWMDGPFDRWLRCLVEDEEFRQEPLRDSDGSLARDGYSQDDTLAPIIYPYMPPDEDINLLAVGASEMLSIRDALIISLVAGTGQEDDKQVMMNLACHPHDPATVDTLYHLLQQAFTKDEPPADRGRCRRGLFILDEMSWRLESPARAQILAVVAYCCWWMGYKEVHQYSREAIEMDPNCTLAAIVCSALDHHIWPAWIH
ncbi:hypothetical protein CRD60_03420 [Bifidobacterium aemilianum]|uniref:DUF4192 domain-containing protein n=1 Tax=Bifidobacterium aemilianum TaxID=2493120 RepID=A0A366KC21_9BIFI|nr:hypothetical protein [Bifidobacterium aemilianum]RBP98201.1 hypothetical protein CRD60_03420 [Bifidobacterium aemilianum]